MGLVSRKQTFISYSIIFLLICIAIAIGFKQQHIENSTKEDTILKDSLFGEKFMPTGEVDNFNSGNLYEKIDGKADLYLNNGFVLMQWRRFSDSSAADKWAEIYLYDMGSAENAFAVYSTQKRSESNPLEWAQFGYVTSDGLYAAAGRYYIEVIISAEDSGLLNATSGAVKNLVSTISPGRTEIPFINLFPTENLNADSFRFISADAFGSELKNIFAAEYKINEGTVTAYISQDSGGESYKNYYKFLIDNGGTELKIDSKISECKAVELFGTTDIIFKTGNYFAGVRGSGELNSLTLTAEKLYERLKKEK